jgi:hypothetical protein
MTYLDLPIPQLLMFLKLHGYPVTTEHIPALLNHVEAVKSAEHVVLMGFLVPTPPGYLTASGIPTGARFDVIEDSLKIFEDLSNHHAQQQVKKTLH